ncbi:MAG: AEC family transporter [Clostridia bacterium]|nr:AEC family transporter [Clostridia bacterium]
MLKTFTATLSPMLVMFLCMALGFVANKLKLAPENTATVLSKLENYFLVPALILNTFMTYCSVESIKSEYSLMLWCLLVLVLAVLISWPLSGLFSRGGYTREIYKYALTFGNFSFMGNAIVPAILGSEMLYEYMLFILPLNIAVYTGGVIILIPRGEGKNILKSLLNPIFVSIIVGAVLGLVGAKPHIPLFVTNTISNLASCMGPLAMVLTGFVVADYDFGKLLKNVKVYFASALRLLILPALFVALLIVLGANDTAVIMAFFAFGTPLGLNTVVFPAAYGGDTSTGASMAMISHTLCIVTIPLMFAVLKMILGA